MDKVKHYVIMDTDRILWKTFSTDLNLLQSLVYDNCLEEAYERFYIQIMFHNNIRKLPEETDDEYIARISRNNWNFIKDRYKQQVKIIEIKDIEDIYNDKNN